MGHACSAIPNTRQLAMVRQDDNSDGKVKEESRSLQRLACNNYTHTHTHNSYNFHSFVKPAHLFILTLLAYRTHHTFINFSIIHPVPVLHFISFHLIERCVEMSPAA